MSSSEVRSIRIGWLLNCEDDGASSMSCFEVVRVSSGSVKEECVRRIFPKGVSFAPLDLGP